MSRTDEWIYPLGREGDGGHHHPEYPALEEHQQDNTPPSSSMLLDDDRRMLITGILIAIMVALSILLCYLVLPLLMEYLRAKIPESKARTERRYKTIEGWLVTKRARAHCDACDRLKAATRRRTPQDADAVDDDESSIHSATPKSIALSPSHDTAETTAVDVELACCSNIETNEDDKECPICMESFVEGDVLSWSPTKTCLHVFHHECLKEWLLYHDNCPYCRVTMMPIDKLTADNANSTSLMFPSAKAKQEELLKLSRERSQRVRTTYYCLEDGLVVLPRPLSTRHCSTSSLRRFMSTRVTVTDLALLRGTRNVSAADGEPNKIAMAPSTTSSEADTTRVTFTREVQPLRSQMISL